MCYLYFIGKDYISKAPWNTLYACILDGRRGEENKLTRYLSAILIATQYSLFFSFSFSLRSGLKSSMAVIITAEPMR